MPIVPQSASFSLSSIPINPVYLLAAPPVRLALPAPRPMKLLTAPVIAGLLPERIPLRVGGWQVERMADHDKWVADLLDKIGPIRSKEEMDAEIMEIVERSNRRMRAMWEAAQARHPGMRL